MPAPKILVIPGSLRTGSHNARLAALAAKELALADAEVTRISLEDYPLPLFDADLAASPACRRRRCSSKRMLMAHQGVFIASPEYHASVTPLLKNAIDWVSRVRDGAEPTYAAFKGRVFAIGSATNSGSGGIRSLMALRQILELGCGALVIPEQVAVPRAEQAFDDMDNLKDEQCCRGDERYGAPSGRSRRHDELRRLTMPLEPRDRLIVALDVSSVEAAQAMVARLGDTVSFYKIGYQLAFAGGIHYAHALIDAGKQVFVDLKLHDIGNTVAQGVKSVARLGATFLTVHAYPQTMKAAVEAREGQLRILAVTVLTSMDDADLKEAGYATTVRELVAWRAAQARDHRRRWAGVLARGGGDGARDRRRQGPFGHARHPAGRRRSWRPEAHRDTGGGDRRGRRLSRRRPADHRGARSESRGGSDRRRNCLGRKKIMGERHGQGLLAAADRCQQHGGLQGLYGGDAAGA